jgi:hypothetical protein
LFLAEKNKKTERHSFKTLFLTCVETFTILIFFVHGYRDFGYVPTVCLPFARIVKPFSFLFAVNRWSNNLILARNASRALIWIPMTFYEEIQLSAAKQNVFLTTTNSHGEVYWILRKGCKKWRVFSSSGVQKSAKMSAGFWNNYMQNCRQKYLD